MCLNLTSARQASTRFTHSQEISLSWPRDDLPVCMQGDGDKTVSHPATNGSMFLSSKVLPTCKKVFFKFRKWPISSCTSPHMWCFPSLSNAVSGWRWTWMLNKQLKIYCWYTKKFSDHNITNQCSHAITLFTDHHHETQSFYTTLLQ